MNVAGGSGSFAGSSRLVSERIALTAASCRVTFGLYRYLDKDGTLALYLEEELKPLNVKTTRLARGLAAGSSVEYADEITLVNALKHRR